MKCIACGKPCYNKSKVHRACRFSLPAGTWVTGSVSRYRLKRATPPPPTASPVGPEMLRRLATLTPAECEVLHLLAIGHDIRDICVIRTVAEPTTRTQIKTILARLGVPSQSLAVALAWRSGWITVAGRAEVAS